MAATAVGALMGEPAASPVYHTPAALQLLLRFLPFRAGYKGLSLQHQVQQVQQHNRHLLLEELHRNPLWRWSNLDEQPSLQTSLKDAVPQEAHSALLEYVRMAAEAEQQQRPPLPRQYRRSQLTPEEAAAELHALYALAVVHVASQQHHQQSQVKAHAKRAPDSKSLSDSDFLDLLKAYVALEDASSRAKAPLQQPGGAAAAKSNMDAAATVQALYAFATLADSMQQQQQQHHRHDAPGQLAACTATLSAHAAVGGKHAPQHSRQEGASNSSSGSDRCDGQLLAAEQDLQVLLQLARLGAQA